MGSGSSNRIFDKYEFEKKIKKLENQAEKEKYEHDLKNYISELLKNINDRDQEAITKHLKTIREALNSDEEYFGSISTLLGGSLSKNTFVDGMSDVDSLVILNNSELNNLKPKEVLTHFAKLLQKRLPHTHIDIGSKAITLKYKDVDVQLLPAIRLKTGIKISNANGKEWSNLIKPNVFTRMLSVKNGKLDGKFIPTIKVIKGIIGNFPPNRQLSGYHIEALSVSVFKDYTKPKDVQTMVRHFFENASSFVRKPFKDFTKQSKHIDSYLGAVNDLKRQRACDTLDRIGRKLKNADDTLQLNRWKELFE